MAKGHPIFNSFAAGEISPRVWSRSDLKGWRNGVAGLINLIATSHGPAIRRAGLDYLGKSTATVGRVFTLSYTRDQAYLICITDTEIQIYNASVGMNPPQLEQTIGSPPWSASEIPLIYSDVPPGGKEIDFVSPNVQPHELVFDPDAGVGSQWTLAAMTFTNQPSEWGANNWPEALTFYQGRMWLGSVKSDPERFWASRPGESTWTIFRDFELGANDDHALDFTLSKQGKIEWLRAAQSLVIGTSNGEHIVTAEQRVITPNDINVDQQSSYGSKDIQAELIGNIVIYVSPDGRKLRDVGYQWEENAWLSRDITFLSEHITRENEIKEVAWAQQPDNIIWGVTEQGNLLGCTYERHYDVIGWHRHDTQGEFLSVATVDIQGTSNAFFAVKRVDGEIYFERSISGARLPCGCPQHYLDSMVHYDLAGGNQLTGITHLANKTVSVMVDGATHPDVTLDAGGNATLQYAGTNAAIGLSYTPQLVTLPLDYTPEEPGTSQHFMKRWNKIFVRTIDSAQPLVGKDRPPERHPVTPMNTPEPVVPTEDIKVLGTGWDRRSQIYVEQDLPLALTITGVYGEVSQEMFR